jgi:magnesium transporter
VDILRLTADGVARHEPDELDALLDGHGSSADGTAVLWVDVPSWDDEAAAALHSPERGAHGHVHYLELDQFVGRDWLITVHGPVNPAVAPAAALAETRAVARRLESGRLHPGSAADLAFAVITAMTGRLRELLTTLTEEVWHLERQVTGGHDGDPEAFLEELFAVRHGLLTIRTMAASSREVFGRMSTLGVWPGPGAALLQDVEDQFGRLGAMAEGQREYLQGVIEFHHTRTTTKMTIAAERLAVIAAVTLPVTALSSIVGMNVIVTDRTHVALLVVLLSIMGVMSATLLVWARRRGWW